MALGGLCLLALSVTQLWLAEGRPAMVRAAAPGVAGLWLFLNAAVFIHTTRTGKFAVWAELLDRLDLKGDERLLDIGCGRGAVLLMAAERLPRGRAVGVDLWSTKDQSGNAEQVTRQNAALEGVAERVELHTADMRQLPFDDGSLVLQRSTPTARPRGRRSAAISRT
ncbi:MAG TPA: class I SAM-dependent methyltransferase, partial [Chthoniobacteraceae bacterium]|nr:class I SAM-dependent methyltransferase [Chthoniobacteraceae bacterium]